MRQHFALPKGLFGVLFAVFSKALHFFCHCVIIGKKRGLRNMNNLIDNIDKLHTTAMGAERIRRNLCLESEDAVSWCKNAVENADLIVRIGKNWYVYFAGAAVTINAKSYTIITAHKISAKIRPLQKSDYVCLNEFLYQAIFVPKGSPAPPRKIAEKPKINIYIKDFGSLPGDLGLVAEQNGMVIGAAWTRIIDAYGHIDDETPELAVAILPEFRGRGIGTKLMKRLFELMRENGYAQTSLSVDMDNPAVNFYKRLGYEIVDRKSDEAHGSDFLMIKKL